MSRSALALLFVAVALPAQNTIVVPGGGGNTLQQAIDIASPGDRLDVYAGGYAAITVTEGITIDCRAGVSIVGSPMIPAVRIQGVPAGQVCVVHAGSYPSIGVSGCGGGVVVDGGQLTGTPVISPPSRVDSCTGPVVFQGLDAGNDYFNTLPLAIASSAQVSCHACRQSRSTART
ncbi:MAG: hypothetical protein IPK26_02235 [Planctomycetes bacterium]|nr:hypothetical protein [Planctomycetota bacterium]